MNIYSDVKNKRKSGLVITSEQSNQFATIGSSITDELNNSINN